MLIFFLRMVLNYIFIFQSVVPIQNTNPMSYNY